MLMWAALAGVAGAQQPAAESKNAPPPGAASAQIDATKLPVNLGRLQRQLQVANDREQRDGAVLRYAISVVGQAPRITLITPQDNVRYGQPSYGAPTHQEMMNFVTPQEFRAPVMDFSNLMRWIQNKTKSGDK